MIHRTEDVHVCECGMVRGKFCDWRGPSSATVCLQVVPLIMRKFYSGLGYGSIAQAERAGGVQGRLPGVRLIVVAPACAALLRASCPEWIRELQ